MTAPIHRLRVADADILQRPGKRSAQIISRRNAPEARVTVTRVVMRPGAVSPRHQHDHAEQTWIVEQGEARLLMAGGMTAPLDAGDVVITPPGEEHGLENTGDTDFIYLTVTTPPEDMAGFYDGETVVEHPGEKDATDRNEI